jgi:TonB family protein
MTVAVANAEDLQLKRFLVYSLILHSMLAVFVAVSIYIQNLRGVEWGGLGGEPGSVNVKLVGPAPGIPLPPKRSVSDSTAVDPTESLFTAQPEPKPLPVPVKEPSKPAEKLQPFKHEKPLPETHKSKLDKPKNPPPDNAVPGNTGTPKIPTSFSTQPVGGGSGPVSMQGQGGGDFASRYAWYIEAVRRSVGQHWLQNTIDPAVRAARQAHCVMTFRIYRDGSARNIQLEQSSGNLSMDNSARRALDGIQFGPLPNDYAGSYVDVTFDFDLALTH